MEVLFNELEIPVEEYSFGRSKIFIRNPRTVCQPKPLRSELRLSSYRQVLKGFLTSGHCPRCCQDCYILVSSADVQEDGGVGGRP